jgi:DNA-binding transcriptional MerR regulator
MVTTVRIGELAPRSGVSIDAIRYYERREVLPKADRTESGYREFDESAVERLAMVRQLQDLGFTLDEITAALAAHDRGGATCDSERWRLERVAERLDQRIAQMQTTRKSLRAALARCGTEDCRLITA